MDTGSNDAVCPTLEGIAYVDDHFCRSARRCRRHRHECPRMGSVLELETAYVVLEEQRDDSKVCMGPCALYSAVSQALQRNSRISVQADFAGILNTPVYETTCWQLQANLNGCYDLQRYFLAGSVMVDNGLAKARKSYLVGPKIRILGVIERPSIKVFLWFRCWSDSDYQSIRAIVEAHEGT